MSNRRNSPYSIFYIPYSKSGFTLVEMLIVAPMIILVIGVFIGAIISMTGEVMMTRGSSSVTYNIQDALDRIENDVKTSGAFLATNNIALTTGQGFDDGTAAFQNTDATNGTMLILNSYATSNNPSTSPTRNIVYATNQPYACNDTQATQNNPVMLNIVYFVKDDTLWRRVIMPSNYATIGCSVPWQKPSCMPGYSAVFCKADDIKLVEGVDSASGLLVEYFQSPSSTTANSTASDPAQSDSIRQTALSTTNTVKVTIESVTTVAGREVKRSGIVQAVAPNNNTKSLLITSQPSDATVNAGSNASFTATSSDTTATVQWQQSTGKDINWSNISGATSTTHTVTAPTNIMDGYKYRAVFTKGSEVIYSNSARLTVNYNAWAALPSFGAGWSDYNNGYQTNGYRKTSSGVVKLKGLIKKSSAVVSGEVIGILPETYRPSRYLIFLIGTNSTGFGRVDVGTDGKIFVLYGDAGWVALDGIQFMSDTGRYTENIVNTFKNNWVNYNSSSASPASYTVDNVGRVYIQGLLAGGITTGQATMFSLPDNLLPSGLMHIPTQANSTFSYYYIYHNPTGVATAGGGSDHISINTMYYPASPTTAPNWINIPLNTGAVPNWTTYGEPYSTPQYTKSADGLVTLKGLIKNGSTVQGSVIATLPVGYRPSLIVLHHSANNSSYGRVDIDSGGNILFRGVGNGWLSLDGISFYADQ